jgi:two-component system, NtrC family, nitrogen regulation response regulator NtrX
MTTVLLIDDEPNIRRMVGALLEAEGYEVRAAADGAAGIRAAADAEPDAVLVDLMMPGALDGMATLEQLRAAHPDVPVIMMSGRAGLTDAVRATRLGAVNFLEKPLAPEATLLALSTALELRRARLEARTLRADFGLDGPLVGESVAMRDLRAMIARVAVTDARVLITGESGTGKELVAGAIHAQSARRDQSYVRVNCAAIPRDLVESEMFGHEKGAFTGATERRIGRFELAHRGTLLLDEVGDLGAEAQAKLLRAIEAREIERVGGGKVITVDARVLAATNRDLARAVRDGHFREDLLFRLNVIPIVLPPLREHAEDIPALVRHFNALLRVRSGQRMPSWGDDALAALATYHWPGNVRELQNIVERLVILHGGATITAREVQGLLPSVPRAAESAVPTGFVADAELPLSDALDAYERHLIAQAIAAADGNIADAARRLRTDRPNLYRRMKRLGLDAL